MVDFAAHFTIHAIEISFQKYYIVFESHYLPIACQSELHKNTVSCPKLGSAHQYRSNGHLTSGPRCLRFT